MDSHESADAGLPGQQEKQAQQEEPDERMTIAMAQPGVWVVVAVRSEVVTFTSANGHVPTGVMLYG